MKRLRVNQRMGNRVRELRSELAWSQEELGAKCGLDRTYISGIERGVRNPTLTVISALASGLGVSIVDLFSDSKDA